MRFTAFVAFGCAFAIAATARADDDWQPGDPPPPGFRVEERMRKRDIIGGALLFGIPYVVSATAATFGVAQNVPELGLLYVPVVGPFIALGAATCCASGALSPMTVVTLVADGFFQTVGTVWLWYGLLSKKKVLVLDKSVRVTPLPLRSGAGLMVGATF